MALRLDGGAAAAVILPRADLFVTTHDLGLGLARRPCPFCSGPLMIRLPSMAEAIRDQDSHALRLGFDGLTTTERELFDVCYSYFPQAVSAPTVLAALHNMSQESLTQHAVRLRKKLEPHGWLLVRYNGSLRLVEPVPVV